MSHKRDVLQAGKLLGRSRQLAVQPHLTVPDETPSLRRLVQELAALSTLSAQGTPNELPEIADALAGVLCRTLPLAFVYVRVNGPAGQPGVEVARTPRGPAPAQHLHRIGRQAETLRHLSHSDPTPAVDNPFGKGTVRLTILPLGSDGNCGFLIAGSPRTDFPGDTDRLLLGVAANQAGLVLQHHQAREISRRSERQLTHFFDHTAVGLHWLAADGTILRANRAELELLGYAPEEYVGHHIAEFHVDKELMSEILGRIRAGEELRSREARLRCKDGSIKHVLISLNVLLENGQFVYACCFTRDITDRKRAEEALRRQTDLFMTLVERIPDIVSRLDRDLRFLYISPAVTAVTGRPAHEYIGQPRTNEGIPEEFAQAREDLSRKVFETGQEESLEFPIRTPGGERFMECRLIPEFAPDGSVESLMTLTRDVTQRKRAEEALRVSNEALTRSNEDLERFAFVASHDLQEPLRTITAYAQLLVKEYPPDAGEEAAEYVRIIAGGTARMRELIASLLTYTDLRGEHEEIREVVDLNQVVESVRMSLKASIAATGAVISSDVLPTINAHTAHFIPLFQNLIGNAIKYRGSAPPRIHVAFREAAGNLRFSVSDNGMGIDPEYHEAIFVAFKRLHGKKIPGSGIGLAICQRVVQKYGGRIWVESEPGAGSTFHFILPAIAVSLVRKGS